MEEDVGEVEGGEKKLVTREMGSKTLGLEWKGRGMFCVVPYANILKITSSVIWKICLSLISLSMILVLAMFSFVLQVILQDTRKFSSAL